MKHYLKLILYPSSINLSWIEERHIPPLKRNIIRHLVSIDKQGMAEVKRSVTAHSTKEHRMSLHHTIYSLNRAAKSNPRERNLLVRVWLSSWASHQHIHVIIFVWSVVACHTKWKCKRNAGHSTSTRGRLATLPVICTVALLLS